LIREFARHVIDVRAESNDGAVAMTKETKDTWQAAPCRGPLTVIARIYAFDLSVRTAYLDSTRGYFNGASVFLYPVGRENDRCTLHIDLSPEDAKRGWRIATTLPRDDRSVDHHYIAANYDELIDHPVEISDFLSASLSPAACNTTSRSSASAMWTSIGLHAIWHLSVRNTSIYSADLLRSNVICT
jgi:predicted metalloprotease with PDZ domain